MNKKGFNLVEMLVVIAIIAVLVAIIIPTVSSATNKAAAAANAANLRSTAATISIKVLDGSLTAVDNNSIKAAGIAIPVAKKVTDFTDDTTFACTMSGTDITCTFGSHTIADYAKIAGGSKS